MTVLRLTVRYLLAACLLAGCGGEAEHVDHGPVRGTAPPAGLPSSWQGTWVSTAPPTEDQPEILAGTIAARFAHAVDDPTHISGDWSMSGTLCGVVGVFQGTIDGRQFDGKVTVAPGLTLDVAMMLTLDQTLISGTYTLRAVPPCGPDAGRLALHAIAPVGATSAGQ